MASDWETVRTQTLRGVSLEGYIAEVIQASDGATYGRRSKAISMFTCGQPSSESVASRAAGTSRS